MSESNNKVVLNETNRLDKMELFFSIAGTIFPLFSLIGLGLNLINKEYEKENIETFKHHIENLIVRVENLEELSNVNKRNFSFNAQKTIEQVIRERAQEKIKLIASLFVNSINNLIIFQDKDDYEESLKILSELNLYEINILITLNNQRNENSLFKRHVDIKESSIKSYQTVNPLEKKNHLGFDEFDINRIKKLISLGLIEEIIEYELTYTYAIREKVISGIKNKKKYKLTDFYDKIFKLITPPS